MHQYILGVLFHGGGRVVEAASLDMLVINNQELVVVNGLAPVKAHRHALVRQEIYSRVSP